MLGYAAAARRAGARLLRGTAVVGIDVDGRAVTRRPDRPRARSRTDTVVCAAGPWSRGPSGPWRESTCPSSPCGGRSWPPSRCRASTRPRRSPSTSRPASTSTVRVQDCCSGCPTPTRRPGFKLGRSDDWLPRLGEAIERRAPGIADVGIAGGWAGLYEMTPDHNALVGEAAEVSPVPVRHRLLGPRLPHGPGGRRGDARPLPRHGRPSSTSAGSTSGGSGTRRAGPSSTSCDSEGDSAMTTRSPTGAELRAARRSTTAAALRRRRRRRGRRDTSAASPVNGERSARLALGRRERRRRGGRRARRTAFLAWRTVPAPARGALVKRFGELLAEHKDDLADAGQPRGREDHLRGAR